MDIRWIISGRVGLYDLQTLVFLILFVTSW